MTDSSSDLARIADALDRIAPLKAADADLTAGRAYRWDGQRVIAETQFDPPRYDLLHAIDAQKATCLENSLRLAKGHAAHDVLLWGARGSGKSATVAAVVGEVVRLGHDLALMECPATLIASLPDLFDRLATVDRPIVLFIDDLGFDDDFAQASRRLRSVLQGSAHGRLRHVRVYATSNRRHIVPRSLHEQDDPVNPRDVVDDRLALADRFGLSLGFHAVSQDQYLGIVAGYADAFALPFDAADAVQWSTVRGSRSGRVAWQYVVELAGRVGRPL